MQFPWVILSGKPGNRDMRRNSIPSKDNNQKRKKNGQVVLNGHRVQVHNL